MPLMGQVCLFYAKAVGTSGVVSPARNWDRLAIAVRRWALALVGNNEMYFLLFSDFTLVVEGNEIFGETALMVIFI